MTQKLNNSRYKHPPLTITIGEWTTPKYKVSLIPAHPLTAIVQSLDTTLSYETEIKASFSNQTPEELKENREIIEEIFFAKVIQSEEIPAKVEFIVRGPGAGRIYSQQKHPQTDLTQGEASLNKTPKTPQELVWVLRQLNPSDPRYASYLSKAQEFIQEFERNPVISPQGVEGMVVLMLINDPHLTRAIILQLIQKIKNDALLNLVVVQGFANAINRANLSYLNPDDFVKIFDILIEKIGKTHSTAKTSKAEQMKALARVLNAMVDAKTDKIIRLDHVNALKLIRSYKDSKNLDLAHAAAYAEQALKRIKDDESTPAAVFRHATKIGSGIYHFWMAFKDLDPKKLIDGLLALHGDTKSFIEFAKNLKVLIKVIPDIKEGVLNFKEGFSFNIKLRWYEQTRYVEWLIAANCFNALEIYLLNPQLKKGSSFVYHTVSRLHEVVLAHYDMTIRQETLNFLKQIYQNDAFWSQVSLSEDHYRKEAPALLEIFKKDKVAQRIGIKAFIIECLQQYVQVPELKNNALSALQELERTASAAEKQFIQKHRSQAPEVDTNPTSSASLLTDKPHQDYNLEIKLEKIKATICDPSFEKEKELYVPLMASNTPSGSSPIDLMSEMTTFLKGDQRVLLLQGDSGSGKSFFCQTLAYQLWQQYQPMNSAVPILVSLPSLKKPDQDIIGEYLERHGFNPEEIDHLKAHRDFVFILDGYDELAQHTDILESSQILNFKGRVIISCRTEACPSIDLFIPTINDKPKRSLLKELYLAPFSASQIESFLNKSIALGNTEWKTPSLYLDQFKRIPGLQELIQNPFILKIITDTLPEIIDRHKATAASQQVTVTRYAIYDTFMEEWFQKGFNRAKKNFAELGQEGLTPKNLKTEAANYCIQLANALQTQGLTQVKYDPESTPDWSPFFGDQKRCGVLRSMAPLKLTQDGVYSFLHKSLQEYWIAKGARNSLVQSSLGAKPSAASKLQGIPIMDKLLELSVMRFLADCAKEDSVLKKELYELMECSKKDSKYGIAAANAISILNLAGESFSRKDLRGVRVNNAYLEGAILYGTDLANAEMNNVLLSHSILSQAIVNGTQMKGARFGLRPSISFPSIPTLLYLSSNNKTGLFSSNGCVLHVNFETSSSVIVCGQGGDLYNLPLTNSPLGVLIPNTNHVGCLNYSGDELEIWDLKSRQRVKKITLDEEYDTLLPTAKSSHVICGSKTGNVSVYDIQSEKVLTKISVLESANFNDTLSVSGRSINLLLLDGEKKFAVYLKGSKNIYVYETQTGKLVNKIPADEKITGWKKLLDESKFAFSAYNTVIITSVKGDSPPARFYHHACYVNTFILTQNERKLICGNSNNEIVVWDIDSRKTLTTLRLKTDNHISSLALYNNETCLAIGRLDGSIHLYDLNTGSEIKYFQAHASCVTSIFALPKENRLASAGYNDLRLWDLNDSPQVKILEKSEGEILNFHVIDENTLLSLTRTTAILRNARSGEPVKRLDMVKKRYFDSDRYKFYSPKSSWIVFQPDKEIFIEDLNGSTIRQIPCRTAATQIILSPNENQLALLGSLKIEIWDIRLGSLIRTWNLTTKYENLAQMKFSCDNKKLIINRVGEPLVVYDIDSGQQFTTKSPIPDNVTALITFPISPKFLYGNSSGIVSLAEFASSPQKSYIITRELNNFERNIEVLDITPDENFLVVGFDVTVRLWILEMSESVLSLPHPYKVTSVQFKNKEHLFVGDETGAVWSWKLSWQGKKVTPELLWVTKPSLICTDTNLAQAVELSEANRQLMIQHGACEKK